MRASKLALKSQYLKGRCPSFINRSLQFMTHDLRVEVSRSIATAMSVQQVRYCEATGGLKSDGAAI